MSTLIGRLNNFEQKYDPKELYVTGQISLPLITPRVSIIGSRKASSNGVYTAETLAGFFAKHNVTIVSGLAEGIDTAAHNGAIAANGQTIAVIGTPLDKFYPAKNRKLQELLMQKHLVISQFPTNYPVMPKNFVIRNRTMALISNATIIVEAKDGSGSLHQGWEALRLGRPLFIRSILARDSSLKWIKNLTHYGAILFTDPKEILDELPFKRQLSEVSQ
ncbi:MAG: DNA-protecting protein DprA [Nitrososphaerota archaeon]|jgi:DNA processing protein|nr:DNA-protecting protein DprA [Nitrososphaerota archaeon]